MNRETGNLLRDSVETRSETDSSDRSWHRVREAGRWRLQRRRRTGDVSGQTRPTQPTTDDSVGTATTRAAGRGRDEAQSLAATLRERRHGTSFTDNSGRHCQQQHSLGRQRVSSPVRQLDSHTGSRPDTSSDSHSDSQSDNSVNDYRVTSFTLLIRNQTVSRFYDRLTVTISKSLRCCLSQNYHAWL